MDAKNPTKQVDFYSLSVRDSRPPTVPRPTVSNKGSTTYTVGKRGNEKDYPEPNDSTKRRKVSNEQVPALSGSGANAQIEKLEKEIAHLRRNEEKYIVKLEKATAELDKKSNIALQWEMKAEEAMRQSKGLEEKIDSIADIYKDVIKELLTHDEQKFLAIREEISNTKNMQAALAREIASLRDDRASTGHELAIAKKMQAEAASHSGRHEHDHDLVFKKLEELKQTRIHQATGQNQGVLQEPVTSPPRKTETEKENKSHKKALSPTTDDGDEDWEDAQERLESEGGEDEEVLTVPIKKAGMVVEPTASALDGEGVTESSVKHLVVDRSAIDQRRSARFVQRKTTVVNLIDTATHDNPSDVPILQYVYSLVDNLGSGGMSSDESDIEEGEPILDVHEMPHRRDVSETMDFLDSKYREMLDTFDDQKPMPRRVRRQLKQTSRLPFEDRDESLFEPAWLSASPEKPKVKKGTFKWTPLVFKKL